jgi:SAM-dependent methyltransferase
MQSTPAHDHANPDLLAVMPAMERVIEVGCSRGALASAYKRQHPRCHYLGIELDATSAAVARAHCDAVMEGDIEELLASGALNHLQPAQCWVFSDTLEHLRDPWQTLRAIRTALSPGGNICACIPNCNIGASRYASTRGIWTTRKADYWIGRICAGSLAQRFSGCLRTVATASKEFCRGSSSIPTTRPP